MTTCAKVLAPQRLHVTQLNTCQLLLLLAHQMLSVAQC